MTAPAVLDTLHAAGLEVGLTAGQALAVRPASRLTDELRGLIRANQGQLLDWLQAADDPGKADPARWCWPAVQDLDAPMNTGEVETFTTRVLLFVRHRLDVSRSEALADKFKRRDREGDDRRACIECRRLTAGHLCTAWQQAGIGGPQVGRDLSTMLQRCPAFKEALP